MTLAELRVKSGKTINDMAQILNISVSAYSFYENGKRKIPAKIAKQIANEFSVPIEELFYPATFTSKK